MSLVSQAAAWRQSPKVMAWEKSLLAAGCTLQQLELLHGLYKRDGSLLFALVKATGHDPDGHPLLPYALVRGPACVVVPVITVIETGERKFLMVNQRRLGHGRVSLEFPAGMLDETLGDPQGVAQKELHEETHVLAPREDFKLLHPCALYSSPGLNDESIWFYTCSLKLSAAACEQLHEAHAGEASEGEHIRVELLSRHEILPRLDSLQAVLALHLYDAFASKNG
jgi:8-oxo-dGTP pyrophosphatase MutT (NUDIX family)